MALALHPTVAPPRQPTDDIAGLLPGPDWVRTHVAERTAAVAGAPCALVVLRLNHRRHTGLAASRGLAAATAVVARSVRRDDWLGRSGPDELAVLVGSSAEGARTAAVRVTMAIAALDIPGLSACAGIVALVEGVPAPETMRRAADALEAALADGPGAVVLAR